jgi:hypothetical protein
VIRLKDAFLMALLHDALVQMDHPFFATGASNSNWASPKLYPRGPHIRLLETKCPENELEALATR